MLTRHKETNIREKKPIFIKKDLCSWKKKKTHSHENRPVTETMKDLHSAWKRVGCLSAIIEVCGHVKKRPKFRKKRPVKETCIHENVSLKNKLYKETYQKTHTQPRSTHNVLLHNRARGRAVFECRM